VTAIGSIHVNSASAKRIGAVLTTAGNVSRNGFEVILNSNSMLDTFVVLTLSKRQRYCVKATASDPQSVVLNSSPKKCDSVAT